MVKLPCSVVNVPPQNSEGTVLSQATTYLSSLKAEASNLKCLVFSL